MEGSRPGPRRLSSIQTLPSSASRTPEAPESAHYAEPSNAAWAVCQRQHLPFTPPEGHPTVSARLRAGGGRGQGQSQTPEVGAQPRSRCTHREDVWMPGYRPGYGPWGGHSPRAHPPVRGTDGSPINKPSEAEVAEVHGGGEATAVKGSVGGATPKRDQKEGNGPQGDTRKGIRGRRSTCKGHEQGEGWEHSSNREQVSTAGPPPSRDECQGQSWDSNLRTMPAWERSKTHGTIRAKRLGTSVQCKQGVPNSTSRPHVPPQSCCLPPTWSLRGRRGKDTTRGRRHWASGVGKSLPSGGYRGGFPVGGGTWAQHAKRVRSPCRCPAVRRPLVLICAGS